MKSRIWILSAALVGLSMSCQKPDPVEAKKAELKAYKKELQELKSTIASLEKEISASDPEFARVNKKATLVTALPVKKGKFEHFVEVSGAVESKRNILISAENMGSVTSILASEGDIVAKGELILTLDTELFQRNLDRLKTDYSLAVTMYEKQKNLWEKNIGTEVQYLEAKNRKESLENQIENINTQISKSRVRSPFSGTIDEVYVREGEMAQMGTPLVRVVNHKGMYVKADLSEALIGKFNKSDPVFIHFPAYDKTIQSTITSVGQVIDHQNRTFEIEAKLPQVNFTVKPNLLVVMKLKDYEKPDAAIIPTNLIQKDMEGDYVYTINGNGDNMISKKVHITRGITYKYETQVESGLEGDEILVKDGFREVIDGSKVKIVDRAM
jgi:RND family efflux transporter MFP subunit